MCKNFETKQQIHDYIKSHGKETDTIIIRGSTAHSEVTPFCDFDVDVYGHDWKLPFYEIIFFQGQPVLLNIYFYVYGMGKLLETPSHVNVLQGHFTTSVKEIFDEQSEIIEKQYYGADLVSRKCQQLMDLFFKYMRTKDDKYLNLVNDRIRFTK